MYKNIFITIILSTLGVLLAQPPEWIDDPGCCEFTSWIVGGIVQIDGNNMAEEGDMFAAFNSTGNVRGVAVQLVPSFGPYEGEIVYELSLRSNAEGDLLSFKYYDASEDAVLDIAGNYEFVINDIIGSLVDPVFYNIGHGGENYPNWQDDQIGRAHV